MRHLKLILPFLMAVFVAVKIFAEDIAKATRELMMKATLNGVRVFRNLEYSKAQGEPLLLDLSIPESTKGKFPLIVWVHGGGWTSGDKENCPILFLIQKGYAIASINYRLSQQAVFPAQIHDCKASIRFLRANANQYNIDPDRIGACGGSAGGHLVALLGVSDGVRELEGDGGNPGVSSRVQAVCDFFGPTDFTVIKDLRLSYDPKIGQKLRDFNLADDNNVVTRLLGGTVDQKKELAEQASPTWHARNIRADKKDFPSFLTMHGEKDPIVPVEQSISFDEALKAAGIDSSLRVYKDAQHGNLGGDSLKVVEAFFEKNLKG